MQQRRPIPGPVLSRRARMGDERRCFHRRTGLLPHLMQVVPVAPGGLPGPGRARGGARESAAAEIVKGHEEIRATAMRSRPPSGALDPAARRGRPSGLGNLKSVYLRLWRRTVAAF